jgi:Spy/CpxP family protein refolding chaperone
MLKHCLLLSLAASLIAIAAPFAAAQSNNDANTAQPPVAQGQDHGGWRHGPPDPATRTAELTRKLNLTSDQQAKVQDLFTAEKSQMDALRQSTSDQSDRRSKMMDLHKSTDTQVRALLDSNQQKKWDEMQAKRAQGRHRGDNEAPPQQ